jgi:DNA integrity scanning protein DisA with diadenylate cyclase activity
MGRYYQGDIEGKFWFGVQDSSDANHFGGDEYEIVDEETDDVYELGYYFCMDDIETINEAIATCIKDLGEYKEKFDEFFGKINSYDPDELAKHLGVTREKYRDLIQSYARLQLGNQIKVCVWEKGECNFTAEL